MTVWTPARVQLEDHLGPFLAQVQVGRSWNGWSVPRFAPHDAESIRATMQAEGRYAVWVLDALRIADGPDSYDAWTPDEDGRYPVGAFSWVWTHDHELNTQRLRTGGFVEVLCECSPDVSRVLQVPAGDYDERGEEAVVRAWEAHVAEAAEQAAEHVGDDADSPREEALLDLTAAVWRVRDQGVTAGEVNDVVHQALRSWEPVGEDEQP